MLRLVMERLGSDDGCPPLGLPAPGSFRWSREAIGDLADAELANEHLLAAARALSTTEQDRICRAIDYRNLGSEELGSIYESLLELHPELNAEAATFDRVDVDAVDALADDVAERGPHRFGRGLLAAGTSDREPARGRDQEVSAPRLLAEGIPDGVRGTGSWRSYRPDVRSRFRRFAASGDKR